MRREVVEPTEDEYGAETHPAFGMIGASRVSGQAVLFDSEIKHHHFVVLRISRATRKRDLNHDWIHGGQELIEVSMSEAQWASFVSSMNTSGVPCTLTRVGDEVFVPEMPYEPRLAQSMEYATNAASSAYDRVREAFEAVKAKPTKANLRSLEIALSAVEANVSYATKTLVEHVENTVVKARADIESMVAQHAERLGIESGNYTAPLALPE